MFSDSEEYREGQVKRESMTSEIDPELAIIKAVRASSMCISDKVTIV